jgi:hypothetical protein
MVKKYQLGVWGVGLSTFLTLGLKDLFFSSFFISKYLDVEMFRFYQTGIIKNLSGVCVVVLLSYFFETVWIPESLSILFVQMLICAILYAIPIYFLSLTAEDKRKVEYYMKNVYGYFKSKWI